MNPINFHESENHPLWVSQDYNKDEYQKQLKRIYVATRKPEKIMYVRKKHKLAKIPEANEKSEKVMYVTKDHTIELYDVSMLRGKVIHTFYRIIGKFGFQNPFDSVLVNYELLKILRYGVSQHFFNEETIQKLAENIKNHLNYKERKHLNQ